MGSKYSFIPIITDILEIKICQKQPMSWDINNLPRPIYQFKKDGYDNTKGTCVFPFRIKLFEFSKTLVAIG